jgi:hypothetical protein
MAPRLATLVGLALLLGACSSSGEQPGPSTTSGGDGTSILGDAPQPSSTPTTASPSPSGSPSASASASATPASEVPTGIILEVVKIENGILKDSITIKLSNSTRLDQSWRAVRLTTKGIILGMSAGGAIRYELVNGNHCVFPTSPDVATLSPGSTLEIGLTQNGAGSFTGAELDAAPCLRAG